MRTVKIFLIRVVYGVGRFACAPCASCPRETVAYTRLVESRIYIEIDCCFLVANKALTIGYEVSRRFDFEGQRHSFIRITMYKPVLTKTKVKNQR